MCLMTIGIGLQQLTLYVLTRLNCIQLIGSSSNLACHKKYQGPQKTCGNSICWTNDSRRGMHQMVFAFHKRANIGTIDDVILYLACGQDHSSQLLSILSGWQPHATPSKDFNWHKTITFRSKRRRTAGAWTWNSQRPTTNSWWFLGSRHFFSTIRSSIPTTNNTKHSWFCNVRISRHPQQSIIQPPSYTSPRNA